MESVILDKLSIGYTAKGSQKAVATGLGGCVRSGELTCLLGQNGIGKSTLLRTLSAFQPPLAGEVQIAVPSSSGASSFQSLSALSDQKRSRLIGVVLTEKPDVRNMTVNELVSLGRSPYTGFWGRNTKEDLRIVDESLQLVGISGLSSRLVDTLSDGERQKVMIAKALAQQTPVIYLDEPTAFLDFPSKVEVMLLLRRISREQQKTIFLSTHDLELALQIADRIWLMDAEKGLSIGTPHELGEAGILRHFVERQGIHFDSHTLTVKIDKTI